MRDNETLESINADLAWWQDVFGESVIGWSFRNTAAIATPGGALTVNVRMRDWFAEIQRKPIGKAIKVNHVSTRRSRLSKMAKA